MSSLFFWPDRTGCGVDSVGFMPWRIVTKELEIEFKLWADCVGMVSVLVVGEETDLDGCPATELIIEAGMVDRGSVFQPNFSARTGFDCAIALVQPFCCDVGMLATIACSFKSPSAFVFLGVWY